MQNPKRFEELSKETQDFIEFMLGDNAFNRDFLITVIQEYYQANKS